MKFLGFISILIVALSMSNCKSDAIYNIKYTDQNNNHYLVTQDTFLYEPVSEENSSSGVYSGGDPVNKEIKKETFNQVADIVRKLMADSSNHSEKRVKTTSILVVTRGNLNDKYFLKASAERERLDRLLEEIKMN